MAASSDDPVRFHVGLEVGRPRQDPHVPSFIGPTTFLVRRVFPFTWRDRDFVVPNGCLTDFASVPPLFRPLFGKLGRYTEATVVHDAAYRGNLYVRDPISGGGRPATRAGLSRVECDALLSDAMRTLGVHPWRRILMVAAVRLFGRRAFKTIDNRGAARTRSPYAPDFDPTIRWR